MQKKYDKLLLGFIIGLLIPLIVFAIAIYIRYKSSPQMQYLGIKYLITFTPKFLSLSVCANLLPFYIFLKTNRMASVRGVLTATFSLALFVLILFIIV
ncbi:MAG: hypothetical protein LBT27_00680 [Prevotellaceae bacterium]|jgi:hypothetical protein|nr:hypothetical protein [Prevotellaceae bacterium]